MESHNTPNIKWFHFKINSSSETKIISTFYMLGKLTLDTYTARIKLRMRFCAPTRPTYVNAFSFKPWLDVLSLVGLIEIYLVSQNIVDTYSVFSCSCSRRCTFSDTMVLTWLAHWGLKWCQANYHGRQLNVVCVIVCLCNMSQASAQYCVNRLGPVTHGRLMQWKQQRVFVNWDVTLQARSICRH